MCMVGLSIFHSFHGNSVWKYCAGGRGNKKGEKLQIISLIPLTVTLMQAKKKVPYDRILVIVKWLYYIVAFWISV